MPIETDSLLTGRGRMIGDLRFLDPGEALTLLQAGALLLDLRLDYELNFRIFAVPEILYIPYTELAEKLEHVPRDRDLVLADNVGLKSRDAARLLRENGCTRLALLAGGMVDWYSGGFPVTVDKEYEMVGGCACKLRPRKKALGHRRP